MIKIVIAEDQRMLLGAPASLLDSRGYESGGPGS